MRRMKGGIYVLKLAWSDGTCSEVSQCFQDLRMTYDDVSFCFFQMSKSKLPPVLKLALAFSAVTLLVGWQEGHLVYKK